MLVHGVPWQVMAANALMGIIIFVIAMLLSVISGFLGWYSILICFSLIVGFSVIITMIPLLLNMSRSYFLIVFAMLISHITTTICSFALHYKVTGLFGNEGKFYPSFYDALYFSITTFTTLGYGDIQPLQDCRLTTSLEALLGMVSMALGASVLWLWCQENMVPKEMTFFDGNRRYKTSLATSRIRIRSITGRERELSDWRFPFEFGKSYFYDEQRQEWVLVTENTEIPENAFVIGLGPEDDA